MYDTESTDFATPSRTGSYTGHSVEGVPRSPVADRVGERFGTSRSIRFGESRRAEQVGNGSHGRHLGDVAAVPRVRAGQYDLPIGTDPSAPAAELARARILGPELTVAVVGLGYVGLPLAHHLVSHGVSVVGVDTDPRLADAFANGRNYLPHIPEQDFRTVAESGGFTFDQTGAALERADVIVVCVPTPVSNGDQPDLGAVLSAGATIGRSLRRGQLVVLESTTYPGTTHHELAPAIQATDEADLTLGADWFLAYSPERISPVGHDQVGNIAKVVGANDERSAELAAAFYRRLDIGTEIVTSCEVAELSKLLENTFRAVNLSLVNEFKLLANAAGIDIWEVVDAASTKPFGFMRFEPGAGAGGHCIPVDPHYFRFLARQLDVDVPTVDGAMATDRQMRTAVVDTVSQTLDRRSVDGARCLVVGLSYKPGVSDVRNAAGVDICNELVARGIDVSVLDPLAERDALDHLPSVTWFDSDEITTMTFDVAVVVVKQAGVDWAMIDGLAAQIVDCTGVMRNHTPPERLVHA